MISVVIPVYNVAEYLSRCLDSVYGQEGVDYEVILINDGSSDNSLQICQQYKEKFPQSTYILDKQNEGLSSARNAGTAIAHGEYLYYIDSDDWLAPGALSILYDYAIANNLDLVQGGHYYAYASYLLYDTRHNGRSFSLDREEAMRELICNDYFKNFAWGKLYKSSIVKRFEFPVGRFYEDAFWQHRIVHECNRVGFVTIPLYYYYQREDSISGKLSPRIFDLWDGLGERLSFVHTFYADDIGLMSRNFLNLLSSNYLQAWRQKVFFPDFDVRCKSMLYKYSNLIYSELNGNYYRKLQIWALKKSPICLWNLYMLKHLFIKIKDFFYPRNYFTKIPTNGL